MYRGSRKHVLDWAAQPDFIIQVLHTILPVRATVTAESRWMPRGYRLPDEARLESFGPVFLKEHPAWTEISRWWLRHEKGANTPNWDLALGCMIEGNPGLILVEAKANKAELKGEGKHLDRRASENSKNNHEQIRRAIEEARNGLRDIGYETGIDRDAHYQLSNRIAWTASTRLIGFNWVLPSQPDDIWIPIEPERPLGFLFRPVAFPTKSLPANAEFEPLPELEPSSRPQRG